MLTVFTLKIEIVSQTPKERYHVKMLIFVLKCKKIIKNNI